LTFALDARDRARRWHWRCSKAARMSRLCCMTVALVVSVALPVAAQRGKKPDPAPPAAERPVDPLGRDTPRGTITGFNQAVHRGDFTTAARYMQLTPALRRNLGPLASDLTDLIDRYYTAPIASLSAEPEGVADDGLPPDRERVAIKIDERSFDVTLVRVKDAEAGQIWLISSRTLTDVPAIVRSAQERWIERAIPPSLVESTFFGIPLARWLALATTIVVPLLALWLLFAVAFAIARGAITALNRRMLLESWYRGIRWPLVLTVALIIHLMMMRSLGFSLAFRFTYNRIVLAVLVIVVACLLWRLIALSLERTRAVALRHHQAGLSSVLMLAERVCKTMVVLLAIFLLLTIAGVDTSTALAGVGLGGVAIALGAQKSVENLLGGVFLLTDRVLAVGDTCSIGNRVGVVEDITMRTVRMRTVEQTLLSIPAGMLSQSNVENFATRHKMLVQTRLPLPHGTTSDQLRVILTDIRALLDGHPDIEQEGARIQLVDINRAGIELELYAYILTADMQKFLTVREDLLLHIAALVESSGTGFVPGPPPPAPAPQASATPAR
jgi:MscS family membrane protein